MFLCSTGLWVGAIKVDRATFFNMILRNIIFISLLELKQFIILSFSYYTLYLVFYLILSNLVAQQLKGTWIGLVVKHLFRSQIAWSESLNKLWDINRLTWALDTVFHWIFCLMSTIPLARVRNVPIAMMKWYWKGLG